MLNQQSGRRDTWLPMPRSAPWAFLEPHRAQAFTNHGQTLERLAERGGLDPVEMWCVVHGKRWRQRGSITLAEAIAWLESKPWLTPVSAKT